MSNKSNILRAFIVEEAPEGSGKKPFFHRVGTVFPHREGPGFDLVLPPGLSIAGRVVCLAPKVEETATDE